MTVWKFEDPAGAGIALSTLESLADQQLITLQDAATVSWQSGAKKPKTRQQQSLTGAGALGGAFWGLLFGLLFFIPLLGMALGAAVGAIGGSMTDVGRTGRQAPTPLLRPPPATNMIVAPIERTTPGNRTALLTPGGCRS